jgi:hypothetical protein
MNAEGDDVVAAPYGYAERRCVNPGATVGAERGRVFPFGALPRAHLQKPGDSRHVSRFSGVAHPDSERAARLSLRLVSAILVRSGAAR